MSGMNLFQFGFAEFAGCGFKDINSFMGYNIAIFFIADWLFKCRCYCVSEIKKDDYW